MRKSRIIDRILRDEVRVTTYAPTVVISSNYSKQWFDDLRKEAQEEGVDARRREVLFAYCFLEAYIVERAYATLGDHKAFDERYPRTDFLPNLINKWKEIPEWVGDRTDQKLKIQIDVSSLDDLKYFRDGLVHAKASRWLFNFMSKWKPILHLISSRLEVWKTFKKKRSHYLSTIKVH